MRTSRLFPRSQLIALYLGSRCAAQAIVRNHKGGTTNSGRHQFADCLVMITSQGGQIHNQDHLRAEYRRLTERTSDLVGCIENSRKERSSSNRRAT